MSLLGLFRALPYQNKEMNLLKVFPMSKRRHTKLRSLYRCMDPYKLKESQQSQEFLQNSRIPTRIWAQEVGSESSITKAWTSSRAFGTWWQHGYDAPWSGGICRHIKFNDNNSRWIIQANTWLVSQQDWKAVRNNTWQCGNDQPTTKP